MYATREQAETKLATMRDAHCYRVVYSKSAEVISEGRTPYVIWHKLSGC